MVQKLSFRRDKQFDLSIELLVDGIPIGELLGVKDRLIPLSNIRGSLPVDHSQSNSVAAVRHILAVCSCGESGCGRTTCVIKMLKEEVVFSDFNGPSNEIGGEFRFSRANFESVMGAIAHEATERRRIRREHRLAGRTPVFPNANSAFTIADAGHVVLRAVQMRLIDPEFAKAWAVERIQELDDELENWCPNWLIELASTRNPIEMDLACAIGELPIVSPEIICGILLSLSGNPAQVPESELASFTLKIRTMVEQIAVEGSHIKEDIGLITGSRQQLIRFFQDHSRPDEASALKPIRY